MGEILKSSLIYRCIVSIYGWFSRQWMESRIIRAFLNMKDENEVSRSSVFYKAGAFLRRLLSAVFHALRLDRVFAGSIFAKPFFWCFLSAALAPVIPTMALLALAAMSCISALIWAAGNRETKLVSAPVNRYIILYAALYMIAAFMSVTFRGSITVSLLTVIFIMSVFAMENAMTSVKQVKILVNGMLAVGVLVSLYGMYQFVFRASGADSWVDEEMFGGMVRVYSTLQNPNVLSEYLLLVIPLAAAGLFAAKSWGKRFIYLCTAGILCICMVLTFSRAGWLGLLFAAAIFLVLLDRRFILLGIAGVIVLFMMAPDAIISRFTSIGDMSDGSTSYRVAIWLGSVNMIKAHWISGIGPGTEAFNMIYPSYSYNTATAQHSHNLFLQIICDSGICGIVVFIILLIVFIRMVCTAISREKHKTARIFQISSLASIGGFMVQSMADYTFYNYRVMFLFWTFIALSTVFCRMSSLKGDIEKW